MRVSSTSHDAKSRFTVLGVRILSRPAIEYGVYCGLSHAHRSSIWATCCCTSCWELRWRAAFGSFCPALRLRSSAWRCWQAAISRGPVTSARTVGYFRTHIVTASLGVLALIPFVWRRGSPQFRRAFAVCVALLVLLPAIGVGYRRYFPNPSDRIRNTLRVPASMQEEGGGPQSPFFPSSAKTNVGGIIPSNFFMDSEVCGECHKEIYEQWKGSAHHFASFNNQFYRKSIEYMQDRNRDRKPSKWCAGCHDHAVFFNGRFDKPIKDQIDTPEAQAGLACTSCHAITHVDGSMGNGGFTIEYPPLHELATSKNQFIRALDRFLTYLNPEPHRKTFLKPFMLADSAEFCSACHKVHLDVPVNNYRWFRGFNDYDNWQASGVSGKGARSFYYPKEVTACSGCHMPLVDSHDPGNRNGKIHSHRFPAANTALAYVNQDARADAGRGAVP